MINYSCSSLDDCIKIYTNSIPIQRKIISFHLAHMQSFQYHCTYIYSAVTVAEITVITGPKLKRVVTWSFWFQKLVFNLRIQANIIIVKANEIQIENSSFAFQNCHLWNFYKGRFINISSFWSVYLVKIFNEASDIQI